MDTEAMRSEAIFDIARNINKMRKIVGEPRFDLETVDYDQDDAAWKRLEAEERRLIRIMKSRPR